MKQPLVHANQHPCLIDRWDPYKRRDVFTPALDRTTFNLLIGNGDNFTDPDLFMTGCLDAPDEIPCGSTQCIGTVGGYQREQYNRQRRDCEDWKAAARATMEVGKMLKKILEEAERDDELGTPQKTRGE